MSEHHLIHVDIWGKDLPELEPAISRCAQHTTPAAGAAADARCDDRLTDECWSTVATRHQPGGADGLRCITCEDDWPCPEIVVLRACVKLQEAHARCTNLSNAEAARIFEEARQMREERDALAARLQVAEGALGEVRAQVHAHEHGGSSVGAMPAAKCDRWVCGIVNRALTAAPASDDGKDS
jgi:hypothetical protein